MVDKLSVLCLSISGDYKEKLLEVIDADQLPVFWGGTATDPDGDIYCTSKVTVIHMSFT